MNYFKKVQKSIDEGQLWIAKEILGSHLAQKPYTPELYEQYGSILLKMGGDMNAGKYLFLSGVSNNQYTEVIYLFLNRVGKRGWKNLHRCSWFLCRTCLS